MGNITRSTKNIEKLIKKLQKLSKASVESGYFIEQGDHPTAEIPYVSLMYKHAMGEGNLPVRNPLPVTISLMNSNPFLINLSTNLNKYLYSSSHLSKLLDRSGKDITRLASSTFGSTYYYLPNSPMWADMKDGNTPLVDEGHLQEAWSYRTSDNQFIRK